MDSSTLILHRAWLRLLKGGVKAYEAWVSEQAALTAVAELKAQKNRMTDGEPKEGLALRRQVK